MHEVLVTQKVLVVKQTGGSDEFLINELRVQQLDLPVNIEAVRLSNHKGRVECGEHLVEFDVTGKILTELYTRGIDATVCLYSTTPRTGFEKTHRAPIAT